MRSCDKKDQRELAARWGLPAVQCSEAASGPDHSGGPGPSTTFSATVFHIFSAS